MANFTGLITGFATGDDVDITRTVTGVPATQTLTKAWLTLKANVADVDPGLLQKAITSSPSAGVGQITDTGASGTGTVLFQLTGTNTLALPAGTKLYYDIKVLTSASKIYTVEQGVYVSTQRITVATS
jgi:hypothetical protein